MADGISEMNRASLRRREDAQALFVVGRYRGAMYVAGYAVECLLKAKLMKMFGCNTLQRLEDRLRKMRRLSAGASLFTHALEQLLRLTGRADVLRNNRVLWNRRFLEANRWIPAWWYDPDRGKVEDATRFLVAVDDILQWIRNNI